MSIQTDFQAFAHKIKFVHGHNKFNVEQWKRIALFFMTGYSNLLGGLPNTHIGHIKGVIKFPAGYIKLSCTDIKKGVFATENLSGDICLSCAELILNSIIHCRLEDAVSSALSQALRKTSENYDVDFSCTDIVPVKRDEDHHHYDNNIDSYHG